MKQIENYPYYVTEQGEVYREGKSKPLKTDVSKQGYHRVTLCKNGKTKRLLVHRIVATAYHPNPDNLDQVMHLDNNTENNHKDNLMWGSNSDNMKQCHEDGRCSNIIASKAAQEFRIKEAEIKWKGILGDRYLGLTYGNRVYINFKCICGNKFSKRTDSDVLKRNGICTSCNRDEDIV